MQSILNDIASRFGLRRRSGKWAGPCPKCGGSKGSDKFNIRDDGGFKCYSCDFKGDIITWLRTMEGKSCPDAHELAGIQCRSTTCPVKGTCRLGDGSGRRMRRSPRSIGRQEQKQAAGLAVVDVRRPNRQWLEWAEGLLAGAVDALHGQDDAVKWLAARGIDQEACIRFRLGWLDHDRRVNRQQIGLSAEKNGKKMLWVPGGLVIPIVAHDAGLVRLRVRRTAAARDMFLPDLKYVWLEGSGNEPLVIMPQCGIDACRGAVIVEAELDAFACAAAHGDALVVAVGSVQGGIDVELRKVLLQLPVILVALDADPDDDGSPGPGPKAVAAWRSAFRQARFWPVTAGKDPGDFVKAGGDLRGWIEAGLAPKAVARQAVAKNQDLSLSPGLAQRGDRESGFNTVEKASDGVAEIETIAALRWCSVCGGDRFLAADDGGFFCIDCQPVSKRGRLVRAGKSTGYYAVP